MSLKNDPTTIVIAGIYRSATTWQYNAVRLLMERAGHVVWGGGYANYTSQLAYDADVYIVKEHRYMHALAENSHLVITSNRDKHEVIRSMERVQRRNVSVDEYHKWSRWLSAWQYHSLLHIPYDLIADSPHSRQAVFFEIAATLTLLYKGGEAPFTPTDPVMDEIYKELESLQPPEKIRQDPVTLLFRNHRSSK